MTKESWQSPYSDTDWKIEDSEIILRRLKTEAADIMYGKIAQQIIEDTGVTEGICLDIGGGNGKLSEKIQELTKLRCIAADINSYQLTHAKNKYQEQSTFHPIFADSSLLSFKDESFDLIISRGSCMFWQAPEEAVKEMLRVLKPEGIAYFGGGIGRNLRPKEFELIKEHIYRPMAEEEEPTVKKHRSPFVMLRSIYQPEFITKWVTIFEKLQLPVYTIHKNAGIFFEIRKITTPVDQEIEQ